MKTFNFFTSVLLSLCAMNASNSFASSQMSGTELVNYIEKQELIFDFNHGQSQDGNCSLKYISTDGRSPQTAFWLIGDNGKTISTILIENDSTIDVNSLKSIDKTVTNIFFLHNPVSKQDQVLEVTPNNNKNLSIIFGTYIDGNENFVGCKFYPK